MDPHGHPEAEDDPVQFQEAINAFRDRVPISDEDWEALLDAEREFAFKVAGIAQLEIVAEAYEAVASAIEDGTDVDDFKEAIGAQLEDSWGGEEPGRLENIFRTNVQTAYNAGRYESATAPETKKQRPYWRLDVISDSHTSEFCEPLSDPPVILPADHAWWQTNYPPRHYQCRDIVSTLTQEQAEEEGITSSPPAVKPLEGFGRAPSAGGTDWEPDTTDIPGPLADEFDDG